MILCRHLIPWQDSLSVSYGKSRYMCKCIHVIALYIYSRYCIHACISTYIVYVLVLSVASMTCMLYVICIGPHTGSSLGIC